MPQVLDFVRSVSPKLKDVPDEELSRFVAETYPSSLKDPEFAGFYYGQRPSTRPEVLPPGAPRTALPRSEYSGLSSPTAPAEKEIETVLRTGEQEWWERNFPAEYTEEEDRLIRERTALMEAAGDPGVRNEIWQEYKGKLLAIGSAAGEEVPTLGRAMFGTKVLPPGVDQLPHFATLPKDAPLWTKIGAGAGNAVVDLAEFFLTPVGIATMGTGSLPVAAQRAIAGAFAADMAMATPEIVREFHKAWKTGDTQGAAQYAVSGGLNTLFVIGAGRKALGLEKVKTEAQMASQAIGEGLQQYLKRKDIKAAMEQEAAEYALGGTLPTTPQARAIYAERVPSHPKPPGVYGRTFEGGEEVSRPDLEYTPPIEPKPVAPREAAAAKVAGLKPPAGPAKQEKSVPPVTPPVTPQAPSPETAPKPGAKFTASTPVEALPVAGEYGLVEARGTGGLVTSFDAGFDQALQPRDRSRQASQSQIAQIVARFEPQRLGEAATTDLGAPITDELNQVLSGNGRVAALRTLYGAGQGDVYKTWLLQNAERFGLDPEAIGRMKEPVLVRRVTDYGKLSKAELAQLSNRSQVMGMSEAEKAGNDAKLILSTPALLRDFRPDESGNLLAASNRTFLNAFIHATGDAAELLSADGYNGPALIKRVKNAILAAVIGPENKKLLQAVTEQADQLNIRNQVNGVMVAAPDLIRLKGTDYDLSAELERALSDLVRLRTTGTKIEEFLGQRDMFAGQRDADTDALLRLLHGAKSAKKIIERLTNYARLAREAIADQQSGGLFGGARAKTKSELLHEQQRATGATESSEGFAFRESAAEGAEPYGQAKAPAPGGEGGGGEGGGRGRGAEATPVPAIGGGAIGEPPRPERPLKPEDDPGFTAFPMNLPVAVRFAVNLLSGVYPRVLEKLRALKGRAAGVFIHTDAPAAEPKGRIELRADIADLLTDIDREALKKEAWEFAQRVAEPGDKIEDIATDRYEHLVQQAYEHAKRRPPTMALKVFWHEIGHLIDWLPQHLIHGRGNLFGRLASLKQYIQHVIALDPTKPMGKPLTVEEKRNLIAEADRQLREELGPIKEILRTIIVEEPEWRIKGITPEDVKALFGMSARETHPELYKWFAEQSAEVKREIVRAAMKGLIDERLAALGGVKEQIGIKRVEKTVREKVGREPTAEEIQARFRELLRDEIRRRNIAELDTVLGEVRRTIAWWHGTEKMPEYFKTGPEMYAEMFSIFANNPSAFQKHAPTYARLLWNYLDRNPEVDKLYKQIQNEIKAGVAEDIAEKGMLDGWDLADEYSLERQRETSAQFGVFRDFLDDVQYRLDRRLGPIYRRARGYAKEDLLHLRLGDFMYRAAEHELFLNRSNYRVGKVLVDAGLDWKDLGRYMFYKRVVGERYKLWNPYGVSPDVALQRLAAMEKNMGEYSWNALELAANQLRALYDQIVVPRMREARMWTPELQRLIEENLDWAAFDVRRDPPGEDGISRLVDGAYGNSITPHIYRQIGTVKEIKNPATATVLKALSLLSAAHRNMAKMETIRMLQEMDPLHVMPAKQRWTGKRLEFVQKDGNGVGTIVFLQDGKPQGFYVPKVIADALNKGNAIEDKLLLLMVKANNALKAAYTQWNYGFWPVNYTRDSIAWMAQMPGGGPIALAKQLPKAITAARASIKGRQNPYAEEALARMMLISRADPRGIWSAVDNEYELKIASYGLNPAAWEREAAKIHPVVKLWNAYRSWGQTFERANKLAGMLHLDEKYPNMPEWKKRQIVRERAGSPDFLQRGATQGFDLLAMFYNPFKESIRSVGRAFKENPGSFMLKASSLIAVPTVLQTMGAAGVFGEDLEEKYRSIPDHDLTNYLNVPLAWVGDPLQKKVLYFRFPLWEPARWLHGTLWQTLTGRGKGYLSFWGGSLPSPSSLFEIGQAWIQYEVFGHNPFDFFRGTHLLDDTTYQAGGWPVRKELIKYSLNQSGFTSLLHRFRSPRLENPPETAVEKFLQLPIVNNSLGRWLKVSNRGLDDLDRAQTEPVRKQRAITRLAVRIIVDKILTGEALTPEERVLMRDPYAMDYFGRTLPEIALARKSMIMRRLNNGKSMEEKMTILRNMIEQGEIKQPLAPGYIERPAMERIEP